MAVDDSEVDIFASTVSEHGTQPGGWARREGDGRVCAHARTQPCASIVGVFDIFWFGRDTTMGDQALGTITITQVGIIVRDIEVRAQAWADILGLPMPKIQITDTVDVAQTAHRGASTPARAKLAFFHMDQVAIELIEPIGEPSTWKEASQTAFERPSIF